MPRYLYTNSKSKWLVTTKSTRESLTQGFCSNQVLFFRPQETRCSKFRSILIWSRNKTVLEKRYFSLKEPLQVIILRNSQKTSMVFSTWLKSLIRSKATMISKFLISMALSRNLKKPQLLSIKQFQTHFCQDLVSMEWLSKTWSKFTHLWYRAWVLCNRSELISSRMEWHSNLLIYLLLDTLNPLNKEE